MFTMFLQKETASTKVNAVICLFGNIYNFILYNAHRSFYRNCFTNLMSQKCISNR